MHWGINLPVCNKIHWGINLPVSHKMHKKGSAVSLVLKVRVFCNSEMAYSPLVPQPLIHLVCPPPPLSLIHI